jgi:SAM-dependent methyltransferase
MVENARQLNPAIDFGVGDVLSLAWPDASWAGAVAFYSLIHLPPTGVASALAGLARVLRAGAPLLVAFHIGDQMHHIDEWWELPVALDGYFYRPEWFSEQLSQAGFVVESLVVRSPYVGHEVETERA